MIITRSTYAIENIEMLFIKCLDQSSAQSRWSVNGSHSPPAHLLSSCPYFVAHSHPCPCHIASVCVAAPLPLFPLRTFCNWHYAILLGLFGKGSMSTFCIPLYAGRETLQEGLLWGGSLGPLMMWHVGHWAWTMAWLLAAALALKIHPDSLYTKVHSYP